MRGRSVLVVLAAAALVVGACGSSDDNSDESVVLEGQVNDHGTESVTDGAIEVDADDFFFSPTFIEAEPGEEITIAVTNAGSTTHTFTITELDVDEQIDAGDEVTVVVTAPDSGNFEFFCQFHSGQGMRGAIVTGTAPAGGGDSTDPPDQTTPSTEGGRYGY